MRSDLKAFLYAAVFTTHICVADMVAAQEASPTDTDRIIASTLTNATTAAEKAEADALEKRRTAEATSAFLEALRQREARTGANGNASLLEYIKEVETQLASESNAADAADRLALAARSKADRMRAAISGETKIVQSERAFIDTILRNPNETFNGLAAARRDFEKRTLDVVPTATLERDITGQGLAGQLTLGEKDSRAGLKLTVPITSKKIYLSEDEIIGDRPIASQFAVELSAKVKEGTGTLGSTDGFANDAKIELSFSRVYSAKRSRERQISDLSAALAGARASCIRQLVAKKLGASGDPKSPADAQSAQDAEVERLKSEKAAACTNERLASAGLLSAPALESIGKAIWGVPDPRFDWTVKGSLGYAKDTYRDIANGDASNLDASDQIGFKQLDTDAIPWAIGASAGWLFGKRQPEGAGNRRPLRLAVSLDIGREWTIPKASKDQTACPANAGPGPFTCVTTNTAALSSDPFVKLGGEFRWDARASGLPLALAPKVTWNFSDDSMEYDFPISFVTDTKEGLNAGIKVFGEAFAGEDDTIAVGLFVGTRFKVSE